MTQPPADTARTCHPSCSSGCDAAVGVVFTGGSAEMAHPLRTLPRRAGSVPDVVGPARHGQRSQIAPVMVQEELWSGMRALPFTYMAPTLVSAAHARALHLAVGVGSAPPERFQRGREFAHLHPDHGGSLHISVPGSVMGQVVNAEWGVPHPRAGRASSVRSPRPE